jgi:hypothetical protein
VLNRFARALFTRLLSPVAAVLLRLGVSPDVVTLVGTLGVSAGALALYPGGHLLAGTLVVTAFVFSDTVDRARGVPTWTRPSTGSATPRSSVVWCCGSSAPATTGWLVSWRWPA